jgi:hypothetical protein
LHTPDGLHYTLVVFFKGMFCGVLSFASGITGPAGPTDRTALAHKVLTITAPLEESENDAAVSLRRQKTFELQVAFTL